MTPAERVLDHLEGVKSTGPGRWMATCPAHQDRRPSLSVREGDDGRVLLHDFGQGCSAEAIVSALGLDMVDLFPPREVLVGDYDRRKWKKRGGAPRIPAADALRVLDIESLMVAAMARKLIDCELLTDLEAESMRMARDRIGAVAEAWGFQP